MYRSLVEPKQMIKMAKLYSTQLEPSKEVKAKPETIDFLLAYSKALTITEAEGLQFENNLN